MKIELLLFANAKDLFGQSSIIIDLPDGATIADLKNTLTNQKPDAAALIARCAFSVNQHYANDTTEIQPEHEIAMIPPVSGG